MQHTLRIAFCITELEIGGAEQCLVELACGLDRQQFTPAVFVLGRRPDAPADALYRRLEAAGIAVESFGARTPAGFLPVLARLTRSLRRFQPDLLQTFLWHANVLGRVAGRMAGVPHVVAGIRVAERSGRGRLWLDRLTDRWVERHVAVSEAVARFSRQSGGLPSVKLIVIPNGVDASRFLDASPVALEPLGLPPGYRAIVCVGRLEPQKRVDWLLRLLPQVVEAAPDCQLLVVGEGPQRPALEKLAADLAIGRHVRFLGFRDDIPAILAASEVLALPSAWEGMPNAVLEAMASSLPVVATDVEGVRELLGDGAAEQVVAVDGPRAFTERLIALLKDEGLRSRLGAANRRRAEEFSWPAMIERYAGLYAELCRNS